MTFCINPDCRHLQHPNNAQNRYCQRCGSDLMLNGQYRVMRLLSDSSGFGDIYEAYQQGTPKILKVLKNEHNNNSKAVELFRREAEVLGKLSHPGIPKIDGYFQYQTKPGLGLHCIVMEKIDGPNLEEWLQQRGNQGINQEQAIKWLKELAEILQLIHESNFFHRDIKPANIMMRNSTGKLVLIDFGTAREETFTYLAKVGGFGRVTAVTSGEYTPPEQKNGKAVPQSDFFALGRTFVHLLTGQYPGEFYDPHNDMLNWRHHSPGVSPILLDFIDKLMERVPSKRPLNTQELSHQIEEMERQLAQKPIALAAPTAVPLPPPQLPPHEPTTPPVKTFPGSQGLDGSGLGMLIGGTIIAAAILLGTFLTRTPQPTATQQSVQSVNTPTPPTYVPPSAPPPPAISKPSPVDAVKAHYNQINNRDYKNSWHNLSSRFKAERLNNSSDEYFNWWDKVNYVNIDKIDLVKNLNDEAIVDANLIFFMKSGEKLNYFRRLNLIWNQQQNKWLIDETNTTDLN